MRLGHGRPARVHRVSFNDDERGHKLGMPCGHEECNVSSERLTDKVNPFVSDGLDHLNDVRAVRLGRKVGWATVAVTVAT
jgi:hypothetical protein